MEENNLFSVVRDTNRLEISFSSSMQNVDRVDVETRKLLNEIGLHSEIFSVSLVMREALTNAVRHGHRFDPRKIVKYSLSFNGEDLVMIIEDQGNGFDWQAARERTPDFQADHGRGLPIMSQYFAEAVYNDKGNKLVLKKHCHL